MEVPQELLDRSATRRASLEDRANAAVTQEEMRAQAIADATNALPEMCRSCIFRPKNADGNAGCMELNRLIGNVGIVSRFVGSNPNVSDSFSITKGLVNGVHRVRLGATDKQTDYAPISTVSDELKDDMVTLDLVGAAAHNTAQFLKQTFSAEGVGTTVETPSPEDITVHVCIRALSDIIKPDAVTDAHDYANLPRMVSVASAITSAKAAGVIFN